MNDNTVMTVKGAAANNTGDAGADLKALSTIVKTAKTDTKGVMRALRARTGGERNL
ncbi:MAG: hypothetical protein ACLR8J_02875 [Sutterella wadsworthensis]